MFKISAALWMLRLDASLMGFFALFLLFFARSHDFQLSLAMSIPVLFLLICVYISNDLDDVEKDRINHPERPLPSGDLTPTFASVIYFISLGAALLWTRSFVPSSIALIYYMFFSLSLSYRYVVEYVGSLKAPYVAAMAAFPVLAVAAYYPEKTRLHTIAAAVFLHILGRELCMNVADRRGDPMSFIRRFRGVHHAIVGFTLQATGLLLFATLTRGISEVIDLIAMAALLSLSAVYWFKFANYRYAITATRVEMLLATYFLL